MLRIIFIGMIICAISKMGYTQIKYFSDKGSSKASHIEFENDLDGNTQKVSILKYDPFDDMAFQVRHSEYLNEYRLEVPENSIGSDFTSSKFLDRHVSSVRVLYTVIVEGERFCVLHFRMSIFDDSGDTITIHSAIKVLDERGQLQLSLDLYDTSISELCKSDSGE